MGFSLFRSKRFWSAVVGLIAMIAVAFIPELEQHMEQLVPAIVAIIGALIGGYAVEDVMNARNSK